MTWAIIIFQKYISLFTQSLTELIDSVAENLCSNRFRERSRRRDRERESGGRRRVHAPKHACLILSLWFAVNTKTLKQPLSQKYFSVTPWQPLNRDCSVQGNKLERGWQTNSHAFFSFLFFFNMKQKQIGNCEIRGRGMILPTHFYNTLERCKKKIL